MSAALEHPPPRHRRPGRTLHRYVAREMLRPTLFALLGLTTVVLTTSFLVYSELVINRGVGAADVAAMIFYEAVPVAGRMFPFAVLVGALVALGRLGADREILVLEASGVAAVRLVSPVVALAGVLTLVALALSTTATPWASSGFDAKLEEISLERPWAQLRADAVNQFGGWRLEAREVSATGTELSGVLLWIPEVGETIFARGGTLAAGANGAIEITLHEANVILSPGQDLKLLRFESATTVLPQSDSGLTRKEKYRLPGLALGDLLELARRFVPSELERLPRAALELHRRFAYAAATLLFGVLAVPLFLARSHFSRSSGGVIGLVCTIGYYGLMQLAEGLAEAGVVGPALAAWLPNLVLAALAAALLLRARRERVAGYSFDRRPPSPRRFGLGLAGLRARRRRGQPRRYALPRYVGGRFLELCGLAFAVLFVAYLLIDVMNRLQWFAEHEATAGEVLRFYGARIWLLASRAVPMALLVATSLTVSLLAADGELIGMRACGIPAPRALLPVLVLAALIAPLYFLLNNVVVPRTNALADELKRTEIKDRKFERELAARAATFWFRSGSQLLEAESFDPELGQARNLAIFELDANGLPRSRTDASRARHIGQGWWRLSDPVRVDVQDGVLVRSQAPRHAQLGETVDARVDTMHMSVREISKEIEAVEADGFDATPHRVDYHVRLAEPFACLILPAVVLFFAVGGPPFPGPAQTLLVGGIIGVVYILAVAVGSALGRGGTLPPIAGAWAPILLVASLAAAFGLRLLRRS